MSKLWNDKGFMDTLKVAENKKTIEGGWTGDFWLPYKGEHEDFFTIGYGHAILGDKWVVEINGEEVNLRKGLTEQQAHDLLIQDVMIHEHKAMEEWTKYDPLGGVKWTDLGVTSRAIMTEVLFNVGTLREIKKVKNKQGKLVKQKLDKWGWFGLTEAIKAFEWGATSQANARKMKELKAEVLNQTSRTNAKGKRLGRVNDFNELWSPRLDERATELSRDLPPSKDITSYTESDWIKKMKAILPNFDDFGRQGKIELLAYVMDKEKKLEEERIRLQELDNAASSQLEKEAFDRETERRDEEVQQRKETTIFDRINERIFNLEAASAPPVDETDKVIDEPLADVQYFQREDGKVIKVTAGEAEELLSGS